MDFAVGRGRRYHSKMQRFYQTWHDAVMAANALLGAGAFVVLIGGSNTVLATVLTGIVAAASALETVLKPSEKASLHSDLSRRFTQLASDIARLDPIPKNLRRVASARLAIEVDEPPVRRLVDLLAHNEECRGRGYGEEHLFPLSAWQRRLGYCADFGMKRLDDWHGARPKP